jgi:hypothetical protein
MSKELSYLPIGPVGSTRKTEITIDVFSKSVSGPSEFDGTPCMTCAAPIFYRKGYSRGPNGAIFCAMCVNDNTRAVERHWNDLPMPFCCTAAAIVRNKRVFDNRRVDRGSFRNVATLNY